MQAQRYLVRVYADPIYGDYYSDIYEYWVQNNGKGFCFNFNTDFNEFFNMDEPFTLNIFYSEKPRNEIKTHSSNKVKTTEPVTIPIKIFNYCVEYLEAKEKFNLYLKFKKEFEEMKKEGRKEFVEEEEALIWGEEEELIWEEEELIWEEYY